MAIVTKINVGFPFTLLQNVVYAMPRCKTLGFSDAAAPTLEGSNTVGFSDAIPIEVDDVGRFETAAPFIRCTDASGCVISLTAH